MRDPIIPKFKIKLFPPGKKIVINNETYTVGHVCIHRQILMIKFKELDYTIDSDTIDCEYDEIDFNDKVTE